MQSIRSNGSKAADMKADGNIQHESLMHGWLGCLSQIGLPLACSMVVQLSQAHALCHGLNKIVHPALHAVRCCDYA